MTSAAREREREREKDPLLKDLRERKQSFRKNVVSLAAELKDVRLRLASQEHSVARETLTRQEAEAKAKNIEEEMCRLQRSLEEREGLVQASASTADKHVKEMEDLRSQLSVAQVTADASAASAQSAEFQCLALAKKIDAKDSSLKEHENRVNKLEEQLDLLQQDLQARELSQKQLKDEMLRVGHDVMLAISKSGINNGCELRKVLDDISPKNFEKINRVLTMKDEEISKLRDEIRITSGHWEIKSKELESQLEKHRKADQELKKRVLKLEFCLQEARSQTRKLQRMGERRDKDIKELQDQLATKRPNTDTNSDKQFWENSGFQIAVSMSMLVLVLFSKR